MRGTQSNYNKCWSTNIIFLCFFWPELHALFKADTDSEIGNCTSEVRRQNVINNPHVGDWFFTQRLESFVKHWLYDTLGAKWHWFRYEYQGRGGSIHCMVLLS